MEEDNFAPRNEGETPMDAPQEGPENMSEVQPQEQKDEKKDEKKPEKKLNLTEEDTQHSVVRNVKKVMTEKNISQIK